MAQRIDGKAVALEVREEVARGVQAFQVQHGRAPGLHVVLAGMDPASQLYVRNKERAAAQAGLAGQVHRLGSDVSAGELVALVEQLNERADVDAILVQLPLPGGLAPEPILKAIDPAKDVDGFHAVNVGKLWSGQAGLVPCTALGCIRLLQQAEAPLLGARAVVVGRSNIVGKPLSALLLREHCTVTMAHSRTQDLAARCREADILVAAVGRPRLISTGWVKPGATVIDVGMNRDAQGKLCGDVDYAAVEPVARAITPAPGGVGPMTIAMLLSNTLAAAQARAAS